MEALLFVVLVLGPVVLGAGAFVAPRAVRKILVIAAAAITAAAGLMISFRGGAQFSLTQHLPYVPAGLELLIILAVLVIAVRIRSWAIGFFALLQLGLAIAGEYHHSAASTSATAEFVVDPLSIILILIVSIIGSVIVLYALGYMKNHTAHAPKTAASEGRFFFFLVGFLGVMNGLVLANDIKWLSVFWEATTLCSFFLIGHDRTDEAKANAKRALLINAFGGTGLLLAPLLSGTGSLSGLMALAGPHMLLPICLLCLAAFTKSAQMPFQSWLLGAMVAPTPVSALLHSATMVKAGSYLVLRLSPALLLAGPAGIHISYVIAVAGAFTFALASALAISQSNGKKVLAYSTIANLGLIVTCAGINSPLAHAAALMILCFHAASKGLLFLCMGTVEQSIGSRDIEDMGRIMYRMPFTTTLMLIGMVSMLVPPFGMLLSKWMAIEASIQMPLVLILIVLGSALTVLFWAKWIGRIQTVSYHEHYKREELPRSEVATLLFLAGVVVLAGVGAVPIFKYALAQASRAAYAGVSLPADAFKSLDSAASFMAWPLLVFIAVALVGTLVASRRITAKNVRLPFLCGENISGIERTYTFRSLMDKSETAWSGTYYLKDVFTEGRMTFWANLLASMIILAMFGMLQPF